MCRPFPAAFFEHLELKKGCNCLVEVAGVAGVAGIAGAVSL